MTKTKRSWSIDSLALIFSIIVSAQLLVYVIPQGEFQREPYPDNPSRTMVVPDTYSRADAESRVDIAPWYFLLAVPKGMEAAQDIIFLIFIAGGVIAIVEPTIASTIAVIVQTGVSTIKVTVSIVAWITRVIV